MNWLPKIISIFALSMLISSISFAGKCSGVKVNDCSTFTDPFKDRSKDCKNAYKAGALYGGYPCKWTGIGTGGECNPGGSCD